MKRALRLLPLIALASAPVSAAEPPSAQQIRAFLAEYGACVVKREHDLAMKSVLSGASFSRDSAEGKRLMQRECMSEELLRNQANGFGGRLRMRFDEDTYRGVIAEALIVKDNAVLNKAALPAIAVLTYEEPRPLRTTDREDKPIPEEGLARQRAAIARKTQAMLMGKLGECAVRAAPAQSRAIIATAIDTPAELQALNALGPTLGQCIKAGETVSLDRVSVRGALAIAYYRLANARRGDGAAQ
ncbi:MAG: hypothetical protein U9R07_00750 [Pseudomonadota bacterium]|nr:hypothetical protein [Pseudomonadota bacterium]